MAFKFSWFSDLLEELDRNRLDRLAAGSGIAHLNRQSVLRFFDRHTSYIPRHGNDGAAFLSCLFPERRTDRVFNLQETRLAAIFGRALGLSTTRVAQLNRWREQGALDFASSVERLMRDAENRVPSPRSIVTIAQIDKALHQLAANSPYSSPDIRRDADGRRPDAILDPILKRLHSVEAKWFVRLLLKSYSPIEIPERMVLEQFHFLLPGILSLQNDFHAALDVLAQPTVRKLPTRPEKDRLQSFRALAPGITKPQVGIMIQRQPCDKARSIKHACQIADKRTMSVERKYDGEYCQIHVNLVEGQLRLQIFSKSGKNSTADRVRLHGVIEDALRDEAQRCKVRQKCILEGELLVWSDKLQRIEPFDKIRKHVLHGGRRLGAEGDYQTAADEHLMIMFYDILLLDDDVCMYKSHEERRRLLKRLITQRSGHAEICERQLVDFASHRASEKLQKIFNQCISRNWEGLMLKSSKDPYFSWTRSIRSMKMKKMYIPGLGDTLDMAITAAHYDAGTARKLALGSLQWTHFYLASLDNASEVRRYNKPPVFRMIDVLSQHQLSTKDIELLNELGQMRRSSNELVKEFPLAQSKYDANITTRPSESFTQPFAVEIVCAAFEKPSNVDFLAPRFPRVTKIHTDRGLKEVVGFDELQEAATIAIDNTVKGHSDTVETSNLIMKADGSCAQADNHSQVTTPGRTPQSMATASVGSASTSKTPPPFLVRIDTAELPASERYKLVNEQDYPALTNSPDAHSPTPAMCENRKRKRHNDQGLRHSKRAKLTSLQATASSPPKPRPVQSDMMEISPTAIPTVSSQPLSDVTDIVNNSTSYTRSARTNVPRQSKTQVSEKNGVASSNQGFESLAVVVRPLVAAPEGHKPIPTMLPTPPSSTETAEDKRRHACKKARCRMDKLMQSLSQASQSSKYRQHIQTHSVLRPGSIRVSRVLKVKSYRRDGNRKQTVTDVDDGEKDVSYQYIERYLTRQHTDLDQLGIPDKGYELVLMRTNDHEQIASQVNDIGKELECILYASPGVWKAEDLVLGTLMILDRHVESHLEGTGSQTIQESMAQKYFVACYVWTLSRDPKPGSSRPRSLADIKVIWNWDLLMEFERDMAGIFQAALGTVPQNA